MDQSALAMGRFGGGRSTRQPWLAPRNPAEPGPGLGSHARRHPQCPTGLPVAGGGLVGASVGKPDRIRPLQSSPQPTPGRHADRPDPGPERSLRPPPRGLGGRVRRAHCQAHWNRPPLGGRGRGTARLFPRTEGRRRVALRGLRDRHHTLCTRPPVLGGQQFPRHFRSAPVWRALRVHGGRGGPAPCTPPGRTGTPGAAVPGTEHAGCVAGTVQRLQLRAPPRYAPRLQPVHPDPRPGILAPKRGSAHLGRDGPLARGLERVGAPRPHCTAGEA